MTYFAAIGIKQIQSYLARSRRLWGRRGASDMLAYLTATQPPEIKERPFHFATEILEEHDGVGFDPEAVDVDSVLNIRGEDGDAVRRAAKALALNIKLHLPATHVQTTLRQADSYAGVIRAEDAQAQAEVIEYPPSRIEFPLAHHCDECSSGMAASVRDMPGDERETPSTLCPDCLSRATESGRNRTLNMARGRSQLGFLVEQVMLGELELPQTENFPALAAMGDLAGGRRTITGNHTALIFADGNGFGKLFRTLRAAAAESSDGLEELRHISKKVKDTTANALRSAIQHITLEGDTTMPAIPHILGGDDILVTVPATRAWTFLIHFLELMKQAVESNEFGPDSSQISFSAGMVICKHAFPFGDQVELAADLLRAAKEEVLGRGWSYSWLDVTNEGRDIPDRVYDLDGWEGISTLIHLAEQVGFRNQQESARGGNNSARSAIRQELSLHDPQLRTHHLRHLAQRMQGAEDLFDHAFGSVWREQDVTDSQAADLKAVLNIMRWHA